MPVILSQFPELGTRIMTPKQYDPDTLNRIGRSWAAEKSAERFYGETNGITADKTSLESINL